jgi:hypothetical protein
VAGGVEKTGPNSTTVSGVKVKSTCGERKPRGKSLNCRDDIQLHGAPRLVYAGKAVVIVVLVLPIEDGFSRTRWMSVHYTRIQLPRDGRARRADMPMIKSCWNSRGLFYHCSSCLGRGICRKANFLLDN